MKARQFGILWVVGLIVVLFAIFSCGKANNDTSDDDDDSSSDMDDDANYEACIDNHVPELLGVLIYLNGELVNAPVEIDSGDSLSIGIEYRDGDCNLGGGGIEIMDPEDNSGYTLVHEPEFTGLGCSSEEVGHPFVFAVTDPHVFGRAPGDNTPYELRLMDFCEGRSDSVPVEVFYRTE